MLTKADNKILEGRSIKSAAEAARLVNKLDTVFSRESLINTRVNIYTASLLEDILAELKRAQIGTSRAKPDIGALLAWLLTGLWFGVIIYWYAFGGGK